jgi:hypothetical protein
MFFPKRTRVARCTASHTLIFSNVTRTWHQLLQVQAQLFPPSLSEVLSVCVTAQHWNPSTGTHNFTTISEHADGNCYQRSWAHKKGRILLTDPIPHCLAVLDPICTNLSVGFQTSLKLQGTNICSWKGHRFILSVSQDFRWLQRKCINWRCP